MRSATADVVYKVTDYYDPADERCLICNDAQFAIAWPLGDSAPILSDKDRQGMPFAALEREADKTAKG